jgi:hypothetical protein
LLVHALLKLKPERLEKIEAQIELFCENKGLLTRQWPCLLGLLTAAEKLVPQGLWQFQQTVVWISHETCATICWWI